MAPLVKRILVVDDDPAVCQALCDVLTSMSELHSVEMAPNGEAGMSAIRSKRPDLVLLDVTMPGADGVTVLKEIRMFDRTIPVIMVTGADDPMIMADALNNGAVAYIGKPFDLRYVENLVALALQPRPVLR
ncbi:MAG TPA: response regulator [Methylomirabilota bacterium]